ncbi:YbaN family protein [Alkalimarinus coralli]|uniref:YbaN family protein n=1 Tax=Alkalimarinus coralli TaxID=2935863 RepID=UPI00202ACA81|nr:YbaN family protein [Alkalimarinus coralli]
MGSTRYLVIILGWLSVILGVIGIFLPLLPTTPFILLAAWCFSRSSPLFHNWLISHPKLGPIVSTWSNGEGLPIKVRNRILIIMWLSMVLSAVLIAKLWSALLLALIGASVTVYIMRRPVIY